MTISIRRGEAAGATGSPRAAGRVIHADFQFCGQHRLDVERLGIWIQVLQFCQVIFVEHIGRELLLDLIHVHMLADQLTGLRAVYGRGLKLLQRIEPLPVNHVELAKPHVVGTARHEEVVWL
jgi:hypothetical protein